MRAHKTFRDQVVGQTVKTVATDNDGLRIAFTCDWNLTVWSEFQVLHAGSPIVGDQLTNLVGQVVESLAPYADGETLTLSSGFTIFVALYKRGADQPEAMMLMGPENLIVVWND